MRYLKLVLVAFVVLAATVPAQAVTVNGATAQLEMRATLTTPDGLVLTFVDGHGWNGAEAYVYTDVAGVVEEDYVTNGNWPSADVAADASTGHGSANGSTTVNTAGFDYLIEADATVEGLNLYDYGIALGDAYAWPDWLRTDHAGTATITIDYTYTLDTLDTCDDAEAYVYMNAFFADHPGTNYLTAKDGWTLGYGDNPNTTIVEYGASIGAGQYLSVSDSVSWDVVIPNTAEPYNWWSTWTYGEVGVEVAPIPEPLTMLGVFVGVSGLVGYVRRRL